MMCWRSFIAIQIILLALSAFKRNLLYRLCVKIFLNKVRRSCDLRKLLKIYQIFLNYVNNYQILQS